MASSSYISFVPIDSLVPVGLSGDSSLLIVSRGIIILNNLVCLSWQPLDLLDF